MLDFPWFCSKESLFGLPVPIDFVAANSKFVAIGLALGLLEDMKDLVVLVVSEVAVCEDASGVLCIFFGEETFCEEGGIGRDVVVERIVDGLDELCL